MQFNNLTNLPQDALNETVKYVFDEIEGQPWIIGRTMTDRNKPYYNAMLKRMASIRKKLQRGKLSLQMLDAQRAILRDLCRQFVITEIGGWMDADNQPVVSDRDSIEGLMQALPQTQFDEMTEFLGDEDSFRTDG